MYDLATKLAKTIIEENYDCGSDLGFIIDRKNGIVKIRLTDIEIDINQDTLGIEIREESEEISKLIKEEINQPLGTDLLEFNIKTENLEETISNFLKKYINYYNKSYNANNIMFSIQDITVMSFISMIPRIADFINISYSSLSLRKSYFLEIYNGSDEPFTIIENNIYPVKGDLSIKAEGINFKSETNFNQDTLGKNYHTLLNNACQALENGDLDEKNKDKLIWLFKNCEDHFVYFTKKLLAGELEKSNESFYEIYKNGEARKYYK
ncbi:hypothetical protein AN396_03505 [Candidatus Epulonipiscium fishelsonii]|uniref:Uncharacterized protein n=1 Tax=Candidatus Epulonipiscium fishelsonii TaxID=77094 RepID=A0ACC8XEM8_9FIRM|nr:hypothetical protein AN396_03505 [Epulopiscium sp. SCG-B11WGA-EpuloA1]